MESYENRNSDHETTIHQLEAQKESLLQSNENMSREISRLLDIDKKYMATNKNVEHYRQLLQKAEETIAKQKEDLATQEIMVNSLLNIK